MMSVPADFISDCSEHATQPSWLVLARDVAAGLVERAMTNDIRRVGAAIGERFLFKHARSEAFG
jgi:hypothetical protein